MDTHIETKPFGNGLLTAVGVLVLLLGTATGSATAMLVLAAIALVGISLFYRRQLGQRAWVAMIVSAAIAVVAAFTLTTIG